MKKYNVVVTRNANLSFDKFENTETQVRSEAAMWNELRKVRDTLTEADVKNGVRAVVTNYLTNMDLRGLEVHIFTYGPSEADALFYGLAVKRFTIERHRAVCQGQGTDDRLEQGGFPATVRACQKHRFALMHGEAHVVQHGAVAVAAGKVFDVKQR